HRQADSADASGNLRDGAPSPGARRDRAGRRGLVGQISGEARTLADGQRQLATLAIVKDRDARPLAGLEGLYLRQIILVRPDRRALDRGQDVAADQILFALDDHRKAAAADAGALRRATVVDDLDQVAGRQRQAKDRGDLRVDLTALKPEPGADHAAGLAQVTEDRLAGVDRQGEADRIRLFRDEGVDADDGAAPIDEGTTRVPGVDRRVGLDHRLLGKAGQDAVEAAHDAAGHRLLEAHRVADRDDLVADVQRRRVPEPVRACCTQAAGRIATSKRTTRSRITQGDPPARLSVGGIIERCAPRFPSY